MQQLLVKPLLGIVFHRPALNGFFIGTGAWIKNNLAIAILHRWTDDYADMIEVKPLDGIG